MSSIFSWRDPRVKRDMPNANSLKLIELSWLMSNESNKNMTPEVCRKDGYLRGISVLTKVARVCLLIGGEHVHIKHHFTKVGALQTPLCVATGCECLAATHTPKCP